MYKKARREKDLLKEFGQYLKVKREAAGLSQSEIARGLGYSSPQFISNFERGLCSPPLPALKKMVEYYGISRREVIELILRQERQYLEGFFASLAGRVGVTVTRGQAYGSRSTGRKLRKVS